MNTNVKKKSGIITNKSDLLKLYFDVVTTEMPFRNITLRLFTRMLQINDNLATGAMVFTTSQSSQLKSIFLSGVMALKELQLKINENMQFIEKYRPELRLYENIVSEM